MMSYPVRSDTHVPDPLLAIDGSYVDMGYGIPFDFSLVPVPRHDQDTDAKYLYPGHVTPTPGYSVIWVATDLGDASVVSTYGPNDPSLPQRYRVVGYCIPCPSVVAQQFQYTYDAEFQVAPSSDIAIRRATSDIAIQSAMRKTNEWIDNGERRKLGRFKTVPVNHKRGDIIIFEPEGGREVAMNADMLDILLDKESPEMEIYENTRASRLNAFMRATGIHRPERRDRDRGLSLIELGDEIVGRVEGDMLAILVNSPVSNGSAHQIIDGPGLSETTMSELRRKVIDDIRDFLDGEQGLIAACSPTDFATNDEEVANRMCKQSAQRALLFVNDPNAPLVTTIVSLWVAHKVSEKFPQLACWDQVNHLIHETAQINIKQKLSNTLTLGQNIIKEAHKEASAWNVIVYNGEDDDVATMLHNNAVEQIGALENHLMAQVDALLRLLTATKEFDAAIERANRASALGDRSESISKMYALALGSEADTAMLHTAADLINQLTAEVDARRLAVVEVARAMQPHVPEVAVGFIKDNVQALANPSPAKGNSEPQSAPTSWWRKTFR